MQSIAHIRSVRFDPAEPQSEHNGKVMNLSTLQGLGDMWMWINIITNKQQSRLTPGGSSMSSPSKMSGSSWSKYLYNNNGHTSDQSCYSQSSYAESDYSLPHSPSSTRPSSQVSALSHKHRTKRLQVPCHSLIKIFKCFVVTIMIISVSGIKRHYSPSITALLYLFLI